jgi:primosomal replication protein N
MTAERGKGLGKCRQEDESQLTRILGNMKHHLVKKIKKGSRLNCSGYRSHNKVLQGM